MLFGETVNLQESLTGAEMTQRQLHQESPPQHEQQLINAASLDLHAKLLGSSHRPAAGAREEVT